MPDIGRPVSLTERAFSQVEIAPNSARARKDNVKIEERERERLLNKLTGHREKSIYEGEDKTKMGKDEFLKLLTHQLQNQDPMNPMDQSKMTGELAQFSQLEQLSNLNQKFDKLDKNAVVQDKFYSASFIGKNIITNGRSLDYKGEGTQADILFDLEAPAKKVLLRVHDKQNNIIAEIWKENLGRGNQTISWDGLRLDGALSEKGNFSVSVNAWDENANVIDVKTKVTGTVESVFWEGGEAVLMVDGKKVFLRDVDSFHLQTPGTPGTPGAGAAATQSVLKQNIPNQNNEQATNFPVAGRSISPVHLNNKASQMQEAMKAYGGNEKPSTGATNIYDE